jgi:hypothetical protein
MRDLFRPEQRFGEMQRPLPKGVLHRLRIKDKKRERSMPQPMQQTFLCCKITQIEV